MVIDVWCGNFWVNRTVKVIIGLNESYIKSIRMRCASICSRMWFMWYIYTYILYYILTHMLVYGSVIYAAHAGPVHSYSYRTCADDGAKFVHITSQFSIINNDRYWWVGWLDATRLRIHSQRLRIVHANFCFYWENIRANINCYIFKGYVLFIDCAWPVCHISLRKCFS